MREMEFDRRKLQEVELGLLHLGSYLLKAGEKLKADEDRHPGAYDMMSRDAEALADAIQIIRQLLGEPTTTVKN